MSDWEAKEHPLSVGNRMYCPECFRAGMKSGDASVRFKELRFDISRLEYHCFNCRSTFLDSLAGDGEAKQ